MAASFIAATSEKQSRTQSTNYNFHLFNLSAFFEIYTVTNDNKNFLNSIAFVYTRTYFRTDNRLNKALLGCAEHLHERFLSYAFVIVVLHFV